MSQNNKEKHTKLFNVSYNGMTLQFELFSIDYVYSMLKNYDDFCESIHRIKIPDKNIRKHLSSIYIEDERKKYHYFAYIKFFEYKGIQYGLVGGKTNYLRPDISFDYLGENDNRIARTFLNDMNLEWSKEIIIINHASFIDKKEDDKQAKFLECFLQRKFNLFDS